MAEKKYINPNRSYYGIIVPRWIARRNELSQTEKLVYGDLATFGYKGDCRPGQKLIADNLGCSVDTVNEAIRQLKRHNLLEVEQIGKKCTNRYKFLLKPEWIEPRDYKRHSEPKSEGDTGESRSPYYYVNNINNIDDSELENTSGDASGEASPEVTGPVSGPVTSNNHSIQDIIECIKEFCETKYKRQYISDGSENENAEILLNYCNRENPNNPVGHLQSRLQAIAKKVTIKGLMDVIVYWHYDTRIKFR